MHVLRLSHPSLFERLREIVPSWLIKTLKSFEGHFSHKAEAKSRVEVYGKF